MGGGWESVFLTQSQVVLTQQVGMTMSYMVLGHIFQNVLCNTAVCTKTCKQAKRPSVEEWLSNGSVHSMQTRTAAKTDGVDVPASTRINRLEHEKKKKSKRKD